MDKKLKKWLISVIVLVLAALLCSGVLIAVVDPYFHYHKPLAAFGYALDNERYQNNGIVKNFDYDAIITGSSMTENFKTSELNALFGVNAVKVPFSGGSYKEVNENLEAAFKHNKSIKLVVRGLDYNRLFNTADKRDYDSYPYYLYDDNIFNDVSYLFNSEVLFVTLQNMDEKDTVLDFDRYVNWNNDFAFGKDAVRANYARSTVEVVDEQRHVTGEEYAIIKAVESRFNMVFKTRVSRIVSSSIIFFCFGMLVSMTTMKVPNLNHKNYE